MNLDEFLRRVVIQDLGWTLVHFLWEGGVIAGIFALVQVGLRKQSANARYVSACVALLLMVAAPVLTFSLLHDRARLIQQPTQMVPPPAPAPMPEPVVPDASPQTSSPSRRSDASPHGEARVVRFNEVLPWLVCIWLVGVLLLSCRLLLGSLQVWRLKRLRNEPLDEPYIQALKKLKATLRLNRSVRLVKSAFVAVPTVIGWLRPVILFPAGCMVGLAPAQLEAILAHELAHIRRHDYLVNLLQNAVETLLFYHPAVWWISDRIRVERENCCDDVAVDVFGDRLSYARALATLEELRSAPVSLAIAADGGSLLARIRRLYGSPANNPLNWRRAGGVLVGAVVSLIVLLVFTDWPALAARGKNSLTRTLGEGARSISNQLRAGDIAGWVIFKGTNPPEVKVDLKSHPALAARYSEGLATRHYQIGANGGLQNALVYIRGDFGDTAFEPLETAPVLDHVNGLFQPYVLGVRIGQQLQLKCSDGTICSFHTAPKSNRGFAIAPLSSGAHWTFTEPEVAVQFKCDLHPWNYAYVGAFAHPYFTVTDEQGRFSIPRVPAGQYTLETFHPGCNTSSKTIAVTNGTTTVGFEVTRRDSRPNPASARADTNQIHYLYAVQDGPHSYVGLTNLPHSNPVSITFSRWALYSTIADEPDDRAAVFRLTNGESTSITLWNVRVQIPSTSGSPEISGGGAIHAGWQTIQNDYPGEGGGLHEAGASGELWVRSPPKGTPWRVCVLYSKERAEDERRRPAERRHYGNYEVISATLPATKK